MALYWEPQGPALPRLLVRLRPRGNFTERPRDADRQYFTHQHILPLHDSGEADSFLFDVMPYIEGETLRDRLDREKQR